MNRHQVKGAAKQVAGKVQRKVGKITGSRSQQAKGLAKETAGRVQKGYGDFQDDAEQAQRNRH